MDQINATTTENEWINQTAMERNTGTCPPGSETYRVQRGDSFYLIARKFGVSVRALMNANPNIAAGHLLVGDILCVPVGEGRSCPGRFLRVYGAAGAERCGRYAVLQRVAQGIARIQRGYPADGAAPRRCALRAAERGSGALRERRSGLSPSGRRHAG